MLTSSMKLPVLLLLCAAVSTSAQSVPGHRITMLMTSTPIGTGPLAAMMKADSQTTVTEIAGVRMRMDVVGEGMMGHVAGDYTLMGDGDVITVSPSKKTFARMQIPRLDSMASRAGLTTKEDSVTVTFDSSAVPDTIDGTLAIRYTVRSVSRTTTSFNPGTLPEGMTIPDQSFTMIMENRYWYSLTDTVAMPSWPARPMPSLGAHGESIGKMVEAQRRLPKRRTLRSSMASTMVGSTGDTSGYDLMTRMIKQEKASIDPARMVIPEDYAEDTKGAVPADAAWLKRWQSKKY